jgi:predicted phosphodiesterase
MPDRKLGVVADVHGNALAFAAVLRDAADRGVETLVDLGDTLYGPLQPLESYHLFRGAPIIAGVRGNQDRKLWRVSDSLPAEALAWLRGLPPTLLLDDEIFLCHGTPTSDTTYLLEDVSSGSPIMRPEPEIVELLAGVDAPVVLCGHSHIPRVVRLTNGQLIVNPGSVGLPAYDDTQPVTHYMETYSPHASYAILEQAASGWNVSLHRVVYDWDAAAELARATGAADWAQGLATGRMRPIGQTVAGTPAHSVTY